MITLWAFSEPCAPPQLHCSLGLGEGHHFSNFPDKEGTALAAEHVAQTLLLHNASTRAHFFFDLICAKTYS